MHRDMKNRTVESSRARRVARVRAKVSGTSERPRFSVQRSLRHISVQIIDDTTGKTLVAASDRGVDAKGKKPSEIAHDVGKAAAEKAKEQKITRVVFDRRDKRYHGRVKAVAEGAREGGLEF